MKIGGIDPKTLSNEELLVLPRGDACIVFRATGLPDMEAFNKLCPEPTPPGKLTKDGWIPNPDDKGYQTVILEYAKKRLAYMVVHSLKPSNIEWETVDLDNPRTWVRWEDDMKSAGLSQVECNRITNLVVEANCLDEGKLKKARELFQRGLLPVSADPYSPNIEPAILPSGEPAAE
jgi:hypothetical protein